MGPVQHHGHCLCSTGDCLLKRRTEGIEGNRPDTGTVQCQHPFLLYHVYRTFPGTGCFRTRLAVGGNSLACAAGIAAFDYYQTEEFQQRLQDNIHIMKEESIQIQQQFPNKIEFVRGIGMSMGIGICICRTKEDGTKEADLNGTFKVLYRCYEKGLIIISVAGNVLRIQPPLIISENELREGFRIIAESLDEYGKGLIPDSVLSNKGGW